MTKGVPGWSYISGPLGAYSAGGLMPQLHLPSMGLSSTCITPDTSWGHLGGPRPRLHAPNVPRVLEWVQVGRGLSEPQVIGNRGLGYISSLL